MPAGRPAKEPEYGQITGDQPDKRNEEKEVAHDDRLGERLFFCLPVAIGEDRHGPEINEIPVGKDLDSKGGGEQSEQLGISGQITCLDGQDKVSGHDHQRQ